MDLDSMLLPDLHGKSDILEEKHVRELSKIMPARAEGYSWTLAFTTTTMGFSLKSLYRALSRYEGPVLLIIKDNEGTVFGAFSSCNLRPSESFYGTGETYLFTFKHQQQQQSTLKRYPWTGDNLYFIKGGTDSLAFGAGEGNFGLWLDEDLYHGSTHSCKTFNNEPLTNHEDFVVCTLECWCFL
uniref:Oxidation resistance protein 1 n=1 Tax=Aceria tosichella TaxID=561515 RepID=A0A6G1SCX8_9ACAR